MAMIMRRRARTILEKSPVSIAIHPDGVGGIEGREPHVELDVGALRIFSLCFRMETMPKRYHSIAR